MTAHIIDKLPEYLLGLLSDDERHEVELHLDSHPSVRAALLELEGALLPLSSPGISPPPSLRDRLLDSLETPTERFAPFTQRLAQMMDIGLETARDYLTRAFHVATTGVSPWPGIQLLHVEGGPATAGADVGFVRVPADTDFPPHHHAGREHTLVLQGGYVEGDRTEVKAGEQVVREADTDHVFHALPGDDLIFAVVVFGVDFEDPVDLHE